MSQLKSKAFFLPFKLLAVLVCLLPGLVFAGQSTVTLGWNAYLKTATPDLGKILIYKRVYPGGAYSYAAAGIAATVNQSFGADDKSTPIQAEVTVDWPEGKKTQYGFVARAVDKSGNQSADSNEVIWTIDATPQPSGKPPRIIDLSATYDKKTSAINCTWTQQSADRVIRWLIFMKEPGGKYVKKAVIDWNKTDAQIASSIVQEVPEGTLANYYLIVVAFDGKLYSENSNEVLVTIDKQPPGKTINLHLDVK